MTATTADAIFLELADLDADARRVRLQDRCGDDLRLRREVEALLAQVCGETDLLRDSPTQVVPPAFLDPHQLRLADARAASDALLPPGARLDEFTVLRVIGSGASGMVYVAQQDRPRRTVALKVLRASAETAGMRRRFALEAELLGRLQHPGIAQVFKAKFGDPVAPPFIAMELVNGPPLTEYADARQLGVPDRLLLAAGVCDAVHHAHQRGVIHRDLKPANILVGEDGRPKVLDFGIARAAEDEAHLLSVHTMDGQVLGTLPFMSPEQVSGEQRAIDIRTDIYTLGVIVYRLLSGRMPFDLRGSSLPDAARRICDEEPTRLGTIDRLLRGDVDTIVARAMAKDKERRYQSAAQLAADLRHAAAGEPIAALDDSHWYLLRRRLLRYRRAAIAASVALVIGAGLTAYAWRSRQLADRANAQLTHELSLATIERGRLFGLTNSLGLAESILWRELHEGPNAEYARWALRELYLHYPSAWVSSKDTGDARVLRISPHGHLLATTGFNGVVRLWDADTGSPRGVLPVKAAGQRPTASFTGNTELVTGDDQGRVQVWDVETMKARAGWRAHATPVVAIAVSTMGDRDVVVSAGEAGDLRASRLADGDGDGDRAALWTIAAADAPEKDARVRAIEIDRASLASPSMRWLAIAWSTGHVDLRALESGRLIHRWRAHDEDWPCVAFQPIAADAAHAADDTGGVRGAPGARLLATGSVDRTVRLWDLESGQPRGVMRPSNGTVRSISFSPDGRSIAITGWWRIEVWDVPHVARVRADIGVGEGWSDAQFSPSGAELLSVSGYGVIRAWELSSRAVRRERVAIGEDSRVTSFVSDDAAKAWALTTNTGEMATAAGIMPATPRHAIVATTSPDGQWVASTGEHPAVQIRRAGADDAAGAAPDGVRVIDEPGQATAVTFSPDARWLAVGFLDGRVLLWDVQAAKVVWRGQSTGSDEVLDLAFDHDRDHAATRVVSAHRHWTVEVWRLGTGEHLRTVHTPASPFALAFDRSGQHCAIGMWSGKIELWNLDRGERVRELAGHARVVTALQFDDPSGRLLSASRDGTVRLWDVDAGQELAQLAREPVGVEGLHVSGDGRTLIFATEDGRILRVALDRLDGYVERNASVWSK